MRQFGLSEGQRIWTPSMGRLQIRKYFHCNYDLCKVSVLKVHFTSRRVYPL